MSDSPFTPEQEVRIREIFHEERDAWKKALPGLAKAYPGMKDMLPPRGLTAKEMTQARLAALDEIRQSGLAPDYDDTPFWEAFRARERLLTAQAEHEGMQQWRDSERRHAQAHRPVASSPPGWDDLREDVEDALTRIEELLGRAASTSTSDSECRPGPSAEAGLLRRLLHRFCGRRA